MDIIFSDRHLLHNTADVQVEGRPLDSFELPARADALLCGARSVGLGPILPPADHGLAPILAVHDPGYLHYLEEAYDQGAADSGEGGPVMVWTFASRHAQRKPRGFLGLKGYYAFGWGTPILAGTWPAAYWSAQCALTAADRVRGGQSAAYALCRPPGHHAAADLYGGYCYLNNAAIAARHLLGQQDFGSLQRLPESGQERPRVAILDVDYHHGNGTQLVFYSDPSVFYASLHADPDEEYPYFWGSRDERGQGPGEGTNHNWPLPRGTGDDPYLETLDEALAEIRAFSPTYLVVSAGFDVVAGDPEGGFRLTTAGLAEIARRIAALQLPTVIVQEGGYLISHLHDHAAAFLGAFQSELGTDP